MSQSAVKSSFEVFWRSYVFDPRPMLPFQITAKRYWTISGSDKLATGLDLSLKLDSNQTPEHALTLVFAHGTGFHKEHWEPTIHRLFEHERGPQGDSFRIQDIWALDAPNHGDAAVLNEDVFSFIGYEIFSWEDYARGIHAFLAGLGSGVDVDFSKRSLLLIGHSMGAVAIMLSTTFFPSVTFASMHLVDPAILGNCGPDFLLPFVNGAEKRKDTWESSEHAYKELKSRPTWQKWDDRILKIYVTHGLKSFPSIECPDRETGVTLKCTRKQEAATFRDRRSMTIAYRFLSHVVKKIPTHITYGEVSDFAPAEWRDDVIKNGAGGARNFASVTFVPHAGHLVVQTHPDALADVIWKSLVQTYPNGESRDAAMTAKF